MTKDNTEGREVPNGANCKERDVPNGAKSQTALGSKQR
jgi:hypothetical protein